MIILIGLCGSCGIGVLLIRAIRNAKYIHKGLVERENLAFQYHDHDSQNLNSYDDDDRNTVMRNESKIDDEEEFQEGLEGLVEELEREGNKYGWFGSTSEETKMILREHIVSMGLPTCVLLQLLHPYVAMGINEHSATKFDPAGRFLRTIYFANAFTFQNTEKLVKAAKKLRFLHSKVQGEITETTPAFKTGERYSAFDHQATKWVWATLLESAVTSYNLFIADCESIPKLTDSQCNKFYNDMLRQTPVYGLKREDLPKDYDSFVKYNYEMWHSNILFGTKSAKEISRFLIRFPMFPPPLNWWCYIFIPSPHLREYLGYSSSGVLATIKYVLTLLFLGFIKEIYKFIPSAVRYNPDYALAQARVDQKKEFGERVNVSFITKIFQRSSMFLVNKSLSFLQQGK